jgi:glycosyltransferase involved in cell wall biosynthesis
MAKAGSIARAAAFSLRSHPITVHTFHGHVLEGYFRPSAERVFIAAERRLARRTDALVAISDEIRDQLLDLGIGRPDQYRVIPLGFDLESLLGIDGGGGALRAALGLERDVPLVGVIGRLTAIKDHRTLFRAIASLEGVHLAVLGDGELREALQEEVQRVGIADRVHFTGWWMDVSEAISDMDVVALSSLNEGTPVALIEASAAAKPVVATDVGGVRSVVRDGTTGITVPKGSHERMASALSLLLQDRELGRAYGRSGREWVRERFSEKRLIAEIKAMYDELLAERKL